MSNDSILKSSSLREAVRALKEPFSLDTFARARLRIMGLYLLMGAIILAGVGLFVYGHIVLIIGGSVTMVSGAIRAGTPIGHVNSQAIVQTVIANELHHTNFILGFAILLVIIIAAYVLAGMLLNPIHREADAWEKLTGNVAHELRTPLAIVKTNTEVMFAGTEAPSRAELVAGLETTIEEMDRMTKIVHFFLNFSLGKDWEKKIELSEVDLVEVMRTTLKSMAIFATAKNLTLTMGDDGPAPILGNVTTLEEMLANLIKNSIAYTPADGTIAVTVRHDGARKIILEVRDTGIGILPKDIPKIFNPFFSGENAVSQRTQKKGTGIGLAIVKEIADLHKAKIDVKSILGKGTTFIIYFTVLSPGG